ncbi:MAG: hypothetical protein ACYDC1_01750 [Limisphaerales bacterium]
MKKGDAPPPTTDTYKTFRAGQLWKVDDFTLQISLVGKTLVHYKRYKGQSKGIPTALSSKIQLERLLRSKKAELIKE